MGVIAVQNKDLKAADLRHMYSSAYNRIGPCANAGCRHCSTQ